MSEVSNLEPEVQACIQKQNQVVTSTAEKVVVQRDQKEQTFFREEKASPKKESLMNTLKQTMKSFSNQKPKHNPLLIEEDIEEQEKIQSSQPPKESLKDLLKKIKGPPKEFLQPSVQSIKEPPKQQPKEPPKQSPKDPPKPLTQEPLKKQRKQPIDEPLKISLKDSIIDSIINLPHGIHETVLDITSFDEHKLEQVFEEIKPEATVDIVETQQKGISKAATYTIKGEDIHGRFTVKRKYNEFLALRKIIAQRWPGSYIPGLKHKFDMKNDDQKSALLIKILANFLTGLSYSKHIYYKEQVQLFLRSPEIDICEMFEQMPDLKVADLISRFQYAFEEELQEIQGPKITQNLSKIHKKLRKIIPVLHEVTVKVLTLAESYDNYVKKMCKFGETMRFYEHFSLAEFTQNSRDMTLLVKDDEKRIDKMKEILITNPFYELYALFQIELIDVRAFLDTVIAIGLYDLRKDELQREIIQNQGRKQAMQSGSLTIKSMATRKGKQELAKQTGGKLKRLHQEKQEVVKMYQIAQKITANKIIPAFKVIKKKNYALALRKWVELVNREIPELESVWAFVGAQSEEAKVNAQSVGEFEY